jgi:5'-methylthioadenosine phosphorylase
MVIQTLHKNTELAQEAVHLLVKNLRLERHCDCKHALATALITRKDAIPPATLQKLDLLVNKYL